MFIHNLLKIPKTSQLMDRVDKLKETQSKVTEEGPESPKPTRTTSMQLRVDSPTI